MHRPEERRFFKVLVGGQLVGRSSAYGGRQSPARGGSPYGVPSLYALGRDLWTRPATTGDPATRGRFEMTPARRPRVAHGSGVRVLYCWYGISVHLWRGIVSGVAIV